MGGYTDAQFLLNPYPVSSRGGTHVINIAKVGAQYTHLFGRAIEAQVNLSVAHGFDVTSSLRPSV